MKYTIEGFNQAFASTLKKDVVVRGKVVTKKIDCTDLVILRWFVDFREYMKKLNIDGKDYYLVAHSKLLDELPLVDITRRAFIERMQKMVELEVLEYKFIKRGGTFSYYGLGKNYEMLISSGNMGIRSNDTGVCTQTTTGKRFNDNGYAVERSRVDGQTDNKYKSTSNSIRKSTSNSIKSNATATTAHTRENDDGCEMDDDEEEYEDDDKLYIVDPTYHAVMLSDKQIGVLFEVDKITEDEYNYYVDKLGAFIVKKGAHVKNHFDTIRKWIEEDRRTGGSEKHDI